MKSCFYFWDQPFLIHRQMLREGAKDLIAKAVELELQAMLDEYDNLGLGSLAYLWIRFLVDL